MSAPAPAGWEKAPGQRGDASLRTVALWLAAAGLAALLVSLSLTSANLRAQTAALREELGPMQATLAKVSTPGPQALETMDAVAVVETAAARMGALAPTLAARHVDWPMAIAAIGNYDPAQITLLSVTQSEREITLKGRAASNAAVDAYVRSLEGAGLFERVVIQSLKTVATPFAPPTPTPTAAPTATPGPYDAYEPDDAQPADIFLGQPQQHTFFPAGDVDRVRFLAKAGRFYRVYTSDLAPGVDTVVTVRLGDVSYTNDDVKPATLRSEVTFQVGGADVQAVVEVQNRGTYGPAMSYRITAEEYIPTPTPAPSATPPPSPTATPTRTPSPTPTPSATATPGQAGAAGPGPRVPGLALPVGGAGHTDEVGAVEFVIVLTVEVRAP
jgi:Tfp pilus assembly protein PilN